MIDAERLLGSIVSEALGGGLRRKYGYSNSRRTRYRSDLSSQLGMTILGVAVAAAEHFFSSPKGAADSASGAMPPPPPPGTAPVNVDPMLLVRTMIAATAADGKIDQAERGIILSSLAKNGLSVEERNYLESLLTNPPSVSSIVADVQSKAVAMEVYLAALLAIDVDNVDEEAFLRSLAEGLSLSAEEVKLLRARAC